MLSKNSGEIFVLDLGDVRQYLYEKLLREDDRLPPRTLVTAGDLVMTAADRYLTSQMHWTRNPQLDLDNDLVERYRTLLQTYPKEQQHYLIDDVITLVDTHLRKVIQLPTWRIVNTERRGTVLKLEVREDYRIWDWMNTRYKDFKHGRL